MDSYEFDSVKAEKDLAMKKYHRHRKFKYWFFEACVALFVLFQSSTWLPVAADFSGYLLRATISVFRSHLFIFVLFNAILLAVYALSTRFLKPDSAAAAVGSEPDLYDEFVTNSEFSRRIPITGEESQAPENALSENVAKTVTNTTVSVTNRNEAKPLRNGSGCTDEEEKGLVGKSRYKRTQSVRFEGRKVVVDRSQREFQRSCTDICRKLTCSGEEEVEEKPRQVNQLSNEEFNQTIEAFIAAKKWIQREEYKEERKTEQYMALTVCQ